MFRLSVSNNLFSFQEPLIEETVVWLNLGMKQQTHWIYLTQLNASKNFLLPSVNLFSISLRSHFRAFAVDFPGRDSENIELHQVLLQMPACLYPSEERISRKVFRGHVKISAEDFALLMNWFPASPASDHTLFFPQRVFHYHQLLSDSWFLSVIFLVTW